MWGLPSTVRAAPPQTLRWPPPPQDITAISVDAAVGRDGETCGVRGIFRNSFGIVLLSYSAPLRRSYSPLISEAVAIRRGLEEAWSRGFTRVLVQSDCENVVKLIKARSTPTTDVGLVLVDIFNLIHAFCWCEVAFIPRTCNVLAHNLAKKALSFDLDVIWNSMPPLDLQERVLA